MLQQRKNITLYNQVFSCFHAQKATYNHITVAQNCLTGQTRENSDRQAIN
uniref:Uncharacterized protein n=1 Tax=Rhizophora mucronata TaxID=61149 RepID=A0A2P2NXI1_RHIMU